MEVVYITYESALHLEEIDDPFRERSGRCREMDGLLRKLHRHDEESGRGGGIPVFDSEESRDALFDPDVHASRRDAYAVRDIDIERFRALFPLHESVDFPATT